MSDDFDIVRHEGRSISVSLDTLPSRPTVMVLRGPLLFDSD
jgi:hypothetical protein